MSSLGVICDSGGVLLRPVNGQWFPAPAFDEVLNEQGVTYEETLLAPALAAGYEYLDAVHREPLSDEAAERLVWVRYYEIVLEALRLDDKGVLAEAIAARSEASLPVEPYPWTVPVLAELNRRRIPVVVLSDAWPSLRRFFRQLGLDAYVRAMVISAEEGRTKPSPVVFAKAQSLLGGPSRVVFVDDWPDHVRAAESLGMQGLRLRHLEEDPDDSVTEITDLHDLLSFL